MGVYFKDIIVDESQTLIDRLIAHKKQIKEHPTLTTFLKQNKFISLAVVKEGLEYFKIHFSNNTEERIIVLTTPIISNNEYQLKVYIDLDLGVNKSYRISTMVNTLDKEILQETINELILFKQSVKTNLIKL